MLQKMTAYSVRNIELLEEALEILLKAEEVLSEPLPAIIVRDKDGKEVRRLETYERSNSSADKIAYLREAIELNKEFVEEHQIVVE